MDELYAQNGTHGALTELSALDMLFAASGTAHVKRTRNGVEENLELPIQSVDIEEINQIVGLPPKVPRIATGGNPKFVDDPNDPGYQAKFQAHNRRFVMAMACMGLSIDIKDKSGEVVWSADNTIRHLDKAMEVLKQMGIVYSQIFAITRAINELTTFAEEQATPGLMKALGVTEDIWDAMRVPRQVGHDLDETTQLYMDVHIALEVFHVRYPVYMAQTTPVERRLYQLYLGLKSQKDEHAHWHAEHDNVSRQRAERAIMPQDRMQ